MRRCLRIALAVALLVSSTALSNVIQAAEIYSYEEEAQVLNDLGLYQGISETEFDPDLGTALNRETGVVMLLRIFGLEDEAAAMTDADAVLAKFSDAASISSWAKNAVAYAIKNGLVLGYPDGTFGPALPLEGNAYCTLILRQLGYTPDYDNAPAELADKGGLTEIEALEFTEKELIKDDLVGISYGSLEAVTNDGETVIQELVTSGVIQEETAIEVGLIELAPVVIVSVSSPGRVSTHVGHTVHLPSTLTATYSDGTTASVGVTWGPFSTHREGTYTVSGSVEGYSGSVHVTVAVHEDEPEPQLGAITLTLVPGSQPNTTKVNTVSAAGASSYRARVTNGVPNPPAYGSAYPVPGDDPLTEGSEVSAEHDQFIAVYGLDAEAKIVAFTTRQLGSEAAVPQLDFLTVNSSDDVTVSGAAHNGAAKFVYLLRVEPILIPGFGTDPGSDTALPASIDFPRSDVGQHLAVYALNEANKVIACTLVSIDP